MNQKLENLLQMSLMASEEERKKEPELQTGFLEEEKKWELIFSYTGKLETLMLRYPDVNFHNILFQYVTAAASREDIQRLAEEPLIGWVEKPKQLFFELEHGKRECCIPQVQNETGRGAGLRGRGVLVAVIDSGIDAMNMAFRNTDGSSRIRMIYDQQTGKQMEQEEITAALREGRAEDIPGRDFSGHGTKVAQIACGNQGAAPGADIMAVKLGMSLNSSFPRTTQLMEAVSYVLKLGVALQMPVAVNLSFGNNYGDHAGTSLLERFINDSTMYWKSVFCIGSGNEGLGATHAGGVMSSYQEKLVELSVSSYETAIHIQIWKEYWDDIQIEIISPTGQNLGAINNYRTLGRVTVDETRVMMLYGEPSPYSVHQEISIELMGMNNFIAPGIWKLRFRSGRVKSGRYDLWLPGLATLNVGTGFLQPDSSSSCTIPGTADRVITVGAYDAVTGAPAPFSGRGTYAFQGGKAVVKPELTAPGVDITLSGWDACSGTSFATPFVTGAAALLMEWGIVQGNDPYLYGEKLKAYLIHGAKQLPGMVTPNPVTGDCVKLVLG